MNRPEVMRPPLLLAVLTAAGLVAFLLLPPPAREAGFAVPAVPVAPALSDAPITPESLAAEVETIRGLRFTRPLQFRRVPVAELEKKVRAAMTAAVPPAEGALRLRAAFALGLIRAGMEFEAADCLTGSAMEVPAAHYDPASATMWVNDAFSPGTRPDLTLRLVFHLARALVLQQPGHTSPPLPSENDDAFLTGVAVLHADATITSQRHALTFAAREPGGVIVPESSTYHASPPFLRAALAFPGSIAGSFHTALREKSAGTDANTLLNRILARQPQTTVELLHPAHYPASPAAPIIINRAQLPPLPALTENSLGEFGILTLFKTQLTSTEAEPAAAGLLADRYLLLAGRGPGHDHLLWRTRWSTAEDATAFLHALAATRLGNAGITPTPAHFSAPDTFRATTPTLTLSAITGKDHTVTFAASPDPVVIQSLLASP
jgi:hypothetical protein